MVVSALLLDGWDESDETVPGGGGRGGRRDEGCNSGGSSINGSFKPEKWSESTVVDMGATTGGGKSISSFGRCFLEDGGPPSAWF